MTDPRKPLHQPKLAALRAYADGRLRAAARGQLERHLAGCATCRDVQRGLQRYALLAGDPREHELPAIDWARIDTALRPEAARLARRPRPALRSVVATLAAAACVALAFALTRPSHAPPTASRAPVPRGEPAAPAEPAPAPLYAEITAIVGEPHMTDSAGRRAPITLDARLTEGTAVETGADAEVHVAVAGAAAFVVPPSSRVALNALRAGETELGLLEGQVVSQVNKLAPGERYEVLAAGRRVRVHGTRFGVELLPNGLAVQVDEGVVQVLSDDGVLIVELRAPQRWVENERDGGRIVRRPHALPRPRLAPPGSADWPVLHVPTWPSISTWELAGTEVTARAQLQMRVPPERLEILGHLADGRVMRGELSVDALGARFEPRSLRWVTSDPPAAPSKPLDPGSASAVIHASESALQRCYERSMRAQNTTSSSIVRVRLRIEIDARGSVRRAALVDAQDAPEGLATCISQVARGWQFAAPGGTGLAFEAPLKFRPTH